MRTTPSPLMVAISAIVSGTGVADAAKRNVLTPVVTGAGNAFVQEKVRVTSVGVIGVVGMNANMYVWSPPAGMSTGVLGVPVGVLLAGFVVWKRNVADRLVRCASPQALAGPVPGLMIVAKAVPGVPPRPHRLPGNTPAARG